MLFIYISYRGFVWINKYANLASAWRLPAPVMIQSWHAAAAAAAYGFVYVDNGNKIKHSNEI